MGIVDQVRSRLAKSHPRSIKAWRNTIISVLAKGGGMTISLSLVPVTIDYLSVDTYGVWLTISSVLSIVALLDAGIGNGLRNKFSEAVSGHNHELARSYLSTSYVLFGGIQCILLLLFTCLLYFLPWSSIIASNVATEQLQLVSLLTVAAVSLKLVLDNISTVLIALQKIGTANLIALAGNGLTLAGTYWLTTISHGSLVALAAVTVSCPLLVVSISSIRLYRGSLKAYSPALAYVRRRYVKGLASLGYRFFFIQIAVVLLFYTDNLLVTQLFGTSEVTVYNIAFRYFNIINAGFAIIISPYWPAFTEAHAKHDTQWMVATYRRLQKLCILVTVGVTGMVLFSEQFYSLWLTGRVQVPFSLSVCMGIFVLVVCWNSVTSALLNGIGKIRLQVYYSLASAVINIPLAVLLAKPMKLGLAGVALATAVALLIGTLIGGIQVEKILSNKAVGMWNQ